MNDLSVQIVNYKTKPYLENCLEGLFEDLEKTELKYEINILDNNSGDDLTDIEEKYKERKINFYRSDKNLGFGGGHNFLSKKTDADYLLILNPDIKFMEEKTVERLFCEIKKNNKTKVVGPKLITKKNKAQGWDHGQLKGLLATIALRSGSSHWKNSKRSLEVAWVSGAVFMIEKKIFDQIDGFDENFFLYKEEEDLCLRIRNLGHEIWYFPGIKVMHIGSVVAKRSKHMRKAKKYFIEKHFKNKRGYLFFRFLDRII